MSTSFGKWALLLIAFLLAGSCGKRHLAYAPYDPAQGISYREVGLASWYGEEYHGRKTANGEVYNMYAMTAAHRTLPFNTRVQVTNLENGQKAELRINDRGPFVAGRIIDVSKTGANTLELLAKGTAKVRVESIGFAGGVPPLLEGTYAIQVAAFAERENAERMQSALLLVKKYPGIRIIVWESKWKRLSRLRLGSFRSEAEARRYSDILRKDNLPGFVVRED
ncbi:MAG: septal ring lytic transglycosylase RlpA family protein [Deltaproteobacteria bacterium]|nr:septal ring lytic transglycosylase RlpA family protein [Deltaproteobacteria bacterium]